MAEQPRTLSEIIRAAKTAQPISRDEAMYAICALDSLSTFDTIDLRDMVAAEHEGQPVRMAWMRYEDSFKRWKAALAKPPKDWLGWENDPKNPEYQKRCTLASRLFNKAMQKGEKCPTN